MKEEKTTKAAYGVGIVAAIAASLCCIAPFLALIGGATGISSSISWLAPLRPYLVGTTIVTLCYAWYQSLKTKNDTECTDGSCKTKKKIFFASRTFMVLITFAALFLLALPYYAKVFYPRSQKQVVVVVDKNNIKTVQFRLKGMSCKSCEREVNNELYKVSGVIDAKTSYDKGQSVVQYDSTIANVTQLQKAMADIGYKVAFYK